MARYLHINDRRNGFTIIETMLAMAVGALIIAVMLMAIPSLQRSSHNNERRQDVQAILAAVSHYRLSNSGAMPDSSSDFLKNAKLSYYNKNVKYVPPDTATDDGINVYIYSDWTSAPASVKATDSLNETSVYNHEKCDASQGNRQATRQGAGFSDIVALYAIETGSGVSYQCQQL